MRIRVTVARQLMGEPSDDGLNTDHRYPVEVHSTKLSISLEGEMHDVAVWLLSHYWRLDEEDRLYPLMNAQVAD